MNDRTNRIASLCRLMDADDGAPPPHDELDGLLRDWHRENAELAAANRARILEAVALDDRAPALEPQRSILARIGPAVLPTVLRVARSRALRAAACIALVALLATVVLMPARQAANASVLNVAEAGELTALTEDGDRLGPCPLQHTDVAAEVTGTVTRVSVRQRYANPYPQKIEAVYTFPLSHRGAVDSMRITVRGADGVERIVEGEVRERREARRMYEDARRSGYVASLLEQERPNVFTQSVANIEPGASVTVEIGYVELLERIDGEYRFAFPMVVAPRYVPGSPSLADGGLPAGLAPRAGVVLLAPGEVTVTSPNASLNGSGLQAMLVGAAPIRTPTPQWMERPASGLGQAIDFVVTYVNGSKELGQFFENASIGQVNGRWFHSPVRMGGNGFAADTQQVPDASRITPMPVRPTERAGHDVSMSVTIDAGGLPVQGIHSELHEVTERSGPRPNTTTVSLTSKTAIPNRDFVLSWRASARDGEGAAALGQGILSHQRVASDETAGGYFALLLEPPARPKVEEFVPRELIFLLDVSGSMQGFPIEKSKEVMTKAIAAMRPNDTFNVITFAGATQTLWPTPRPASEENRRIARDFVEGNSGGGGTEMLPAIAAALNADRNAGWSTPHELLDLPADGRAVRVEVPMTAVRADQGELSAENGKSVKVRFGVRLPESGSRDQSLQMTGRWVTESGDRVYIVDSARFARSASAANRTVVFLSDGLVGNDGAILDLVRQHAKTTRVFAFGIGNSVNRSLLDGVARAGRGAVEFVTLPADADAAVARLTARLTAPVLLDIEVAFQGVEVTDVIPPLDRIPDLYDQSPLVLVGRYAKPGSGTVLVRGRNADGAWERTTPVTFTASDHGNEALASLWARARVDETAASHEDAIAKGTAPPEVAREIVRLGERYSLLTALTSFVAIEKSRVTIGGQPMLVQIPIELPEGMSWKGLFGEGVAPAQWAVRGAPQDTPQERESFYRRRLAVTSLATQIDATYKDQEGNAPADAKADVALWFFGAEPGHRLSVQMDADGLDELHTAVGLKSEDLKRLDDSKAEELRELGFVIASTPTPSGGGGGGGRGAPSVGQASPAFSGEGRSYGTNGQFGGLPGKRPPGGNLAPADRGGGFAGDPGDGVLAPGTPATSDTSTLNAKRRSRGETAPPAAAPGQAKPGSADPSAGQDKRPDPASSTLSEEVHPTAPTGTNAPATPGAAGGDASGSTREAKAKSEAPKPAPPQSLAPPAAAPSDPKGDPKELAPATPVPAPPAPARSMESGSVVRDAMGPGAPPAPAPVAAQSGADRPMGDASHATDPANRFEGAKTDASKDTATDAPSAARPTIRLTDADRDRLARRLQRELLVIALAALIDERTSVELAATATPVIPIDQDGRIRVTILIERTSAEALATRIEALRKAGAIIDGEERQTHLVVARVTLRDLITLALTDGVRRIELTRSAPDTPRPIR